MKEGEKMRLHILSTGDEVHRYQKSVVIPFSGKRKVLSTSANNGGYQENLTAIYNHDASNGPGMACNMKADTYEEHMAILTDEIGLDRNTTAGISTAAQMENVAINSATFEDLTVTAIVTGGVEVNGGRVGDPSSYHERDNQVYMVKPGTINIILCIDGDMPAYAMTRALVTCTEAKTAALQELMSGSRYSRGLATGSGTDGTIVMANSESENYFRHAGKHGKLGELIGLAVKPAVKEALYLQTGLSPEFQHKILRRLKRFGVTEDTIWEVYAEDHDELKATFIEKLEKTDPKNDLVVKVSIIAHLLDQLDWELLSPGEVKKEVASIMKQICESYDLDYDPDIIEGNKDETVNSVINNLVNMIALIV
jgi:adenosylcobinamide amidohydrolase